MVRNYHRKSLRATQYTQESLLNAVEEVKAKRMTYNQACNIYNIPKTTLLYHVTGKRGVKSSSFGRPISLPLPLEQELANGLITMEKWGFGLSRTEIMDLVADYVNTNNINTPFKDGIPGEDWFLNFKKRHNLSVKKPQSVEYTRKKSVNPFTVYSYMDLLGKTLDKLNLHDKPSQVWNLDETSFCLDPSKTKVVGAKGHVSSRMVSGPGRENISVLFASSANGDKLPPLIIFKGKNIWDRWVTLDGEYPNTAYAATQNGWMEAPVFLNYFTKTFIKYIPDQRPILLVFDGHSTHLGLNLILEAIKNNITILKLPPHTSHILQPLDLSTFKSLKGKWDAKLVIWQRKNVGKKLPKPQFSKIIGDIWKDISPIVLKEGFKKGGIIPFNKDVIDQKIFDPTALLQWKAKNAISNNNVRVNNTESIANPNISFDFPESINPANVSMASTSNFELDSPHASTLNVSTSFEELLLQTCKQVKPIEGPQKRKRVATGAEVITSNDYLDKLLEAEQEKKAIEAKKKKNPVSKEIDIEIEKEENNEDNMSNNSELNENGIELLPVNEDHFNKPVSDKGEGDWVLVRFFSFKQNTYYYVGQIVENNSCCTVKFLRKFKKKGQNACSFVWPHVEDIGMVLDEDIMVILPEPSKGRRGEMLFDIDFSIYNVQ